MNFVLLHYSSNVAVLYSLPYPHSPTNAIRVDEDYYREDILWKIMGTYVDPDAVDPEGKYSIAKFGIIIKREGNTITLTIIIPGYLIALMSMLYIFLPRGGKGMRIYYLSNILLTSTMFLIIFTEFVPITNETPRVAAIFFMLTMSLCLIIAPVMYLERKQR